MNKRLAELHIQRGRLIERIAAQRVALARDLQPVGAATRRVSGWLDKVRAVIDTLKRYPALTAVAATGVIAVRGGSLWKWSRRVLSLWQLWRLVQRKRSELGLRVRS